MLIVKRKTFFFLDKKILSLNFLKKNFFKKNLSFFINFFFKKSNLFSNNFNIIILKFLKKKFAMTQFRYFNMVILHFVKSRLFFLKKKRFIKKWLKKLFYKNLT